MLGKVTTGHTQCRVLRFRLEAIRSEVPAKSELSSWIFYVTVKYMHSNVILVTVTGHDSPGITSEITRILAQHPAEIIDIAQAVIQGNLSLSFMFKLRNSQETEEAILKDLLHKTNHLN